MFLLILIFVVSLSLANFKDYSTKQPHIITILVDDLGWSDVSFHGSDQIPTPNIDALAYSGIILNRHYVLPTCTPSRTALLTGSYPIRHGMHGYPMKAGEARGIPLQAKLLPQYLKDLGYETHMVGKWHLGYMTPDYLPNHRGFDSFFGYYNGYTEYFKYGLNQSLTLNHSKAHFYGYDLHFNDNVNWKDRGNYATRLFTDRAVKLIKQHNSNNPLFMYISHLAVHTGSSEGLGLEIPDDIDVNKTFPYIKDYPRRLYAGMIQELDKSVGAVVEALSDAQMLENSIILIMADNGAQPVSVDMQPNYGSNWPLRGTKFTMYEGGVRGTALIWSPHLLQGVVSDQFLHISDWLPTFYRAAGGNPEDLQDIDGVDQWNALRKHLTIQRDHILLNIDEAEHTEGVILHNRWKLVKGGMMNYANYDFHWGRESNSKYPAKYNFTHVAESQAGRSILSVLGYENTLNLNSIEELREDAAVVCNDLESLSEINKKHFGEVNGSYRFFCPEYCLFDIIKDPCELNDIRLEEVMSLGIEKLDSYRKQIVPQTNGPVDPKSNPELWGGVWSPWLKSGSSKVIGSIFYTILCFVTYHLVLIKHCSAFCI